MTGAKFKVTTLIRSILLADKRLTEIIEDKIFPVIAPKDTTGDFVLYNRDEYSIDRTQMGIATQTCKVYINAISEDYDRSQDIAALVFEILEGTFSNPEMRIRLVDSTEDYEEGKYIQVLLFSIE